MRNNAWENRLVLDYGVRVDLETIVHEMRAEMFPEYSMYNFTMDSGYGRKHQLTNPENGEKFVIMYNKKYHSFEICSDNSTGIDTARAFTYIVNKITQEHKVH